MQNLNITIYTRDNCPNCVTAKRIMDSAGLTYDEVDIMVGDSGEIDKSAHIE